MEAATGARVTVRCPPSAASSFLCLESVPRDAPSTFNYCQLDDFPRALTEGHFEFRDAKRSLRKVLR